MNRFCGISLQSKSGGGGGIQKSGYEGSQLLVDFVFSLGLVNSLDFTGTFELVLHPNS